MCLYERNLKNGNAHQKLQPQEYDPTPDVLQLQDCNPTPNFAKVVQHSKMEKLAKNLNPTEKYPGCLFGHKSAKTTRACRYQGNRR